MDMAILSVYGVIVQLLLIGLCYWRMSPRARRSMLPTNWTLVKLVINIHRFHELVTDVLKKRGGTYVFKCSFFSSLDFVITADPANIQYILSKNFSNYPKGPRFKTIFDIFGDVLLTNDSELWRFERQLMGTIVSHHEFHDLLQRTTWEKVDKGLIPILENACNNSLVVDLQDVFQRLTFDVTCSLLLDYDPISLSITLPYIRCEKAATDIEEALFFRHLLPEACWKLQRVLGIGKEKTLKKAAESFDELIHRCVSLKLDDNAAGSTTGNEPFNMIISLKDAFDKIRDDWDPKKLLRDGLLSLTIAGKNTISTTLTWFFWLLSRNPQVEKKIQDEIKNILKLKKKSEDDDQSAFHHLSTEESQKLVYLHGAICETMRLYPPVWIQHKTPVESDVLPSGHKIDKGTKVYLSFYSVGRMETVWGDDCLEFQPERWITETGGVRRVPFYKFPAFNGGPRTCVGINMAFTELKAVAAAVVYNYNIQVVQGQQITPSNSIILELKHGLNVKITKRSG